MPPSSAWIRASTMIMTPPMIHEMIAAGPAATRPFCAPKSQPEPMMEPTDAQISPILPTSRTREVERWGRGVVAVSDMADQPSREDAPVNHLNYDGPLLETT